jgi:superfamily II DNA or RNA helicase
MLVPTNDIPVQTDALCWFPYSAALDKQMTIKSKFEDEPIKLGQVKGKYLGLPRQLCRNYGPKDLRQEGAFCDLKCTTPPRNDEQVRILKTSKALLTAGESFVLQATTGFGKTYCASNMIGHVQRPTLVVVTKEDLMKQWRDELKIFLGLKDEEIGKAQGDVCDYKGKKVVLAMVHSLAKDKYPPEFREYFGFVIFDEVHRMGAETFSKTCGMFPAKLRLGLSATVNRTDGKSAIFTSHIGPVRVKTAMQNLPLKVLFRKTGFKPRQRIKVEPARMMGMYKAMAADYQRNQMIIDFVFSAYHKDRTIIVFSELKEAHLVPLMQKAIHAGIPAEEMTLYVGGMTEKKRHEAKSKRVWWATYAMTAEATDNPKLDTAVLATPRANILQPVGRILRESPGKKEPVVLDLVDTCAHILQTFTSKRRTQYFSLKAKMLDI